VVDPRLPLPHDQDVHLKGRRLAVVVPAGQRGNRIGAGDEAALLALLADIPAVRDDKVEIGFVDQGNPPGGNLAVQGYLAAVRRSEVDLPAPAAA
jgi:hypothetical protein